MAREDLLGKLLLTFSQKQNIDDTDDNTTLFKITAPQDSVTLSDSITTYHPALLSEVWGGTGYTANWQWGQGQWR